MANNFDFIDISAKGYSFAWRWRRYLVRCALPVIFVKLLCLLAVFALGASDLHLRQGLINMPAFIVEAIFVIALIRFVVYKEPISMWGRAMPMPDGEVTTTPHSGRLSKKQSVQGGIAIYLLLRVIEMLVSGVEKDYLSKDIASDLAVTPPPNIMEMNAVAPMGAIFAMMIAMLIFVWTFRFFWLFIPTALGYSFSDFLRQGSAFKTSLSMIATWFVCSLPLILLYAILLELFTGSLAQGSAISIIVQSLLQSIVEMAIISVQIISMTFGVVHILFSRQEK